MKGELCIIMKKVNKKLIALGLLIISLLFIAPTERVNAAGSNSKHKVFILAGQSNMAGCGMNHELSAEYLGEVEKVKIYAEGTVESSLKGTWSTLRPGFGSGSGCFGPELTFGKEISKAYPDCEILLIKCGWSGTSLQGDWRPPSAGGATGPLYKNLIETVNKALGALDKSIDYEFAGMCWMQGESDACNIFPAKEYEENLTAFINDVRKELNAPTMPFVIAMIDDSDAWIENAIVRQAQIDVANKVDNVYIFDTKDYDTDGMHYKTQGILDMGYDFAKAIISAGGAPSKIVYGDVNGDGKFDSLDYATVKKYLLGMMDGFTYSDGYKAADVNGDGTINSIDLALIKSRLLGLIDKFPVENK